MLVVVARWARHDIDGATVSLLLPVYIVTGTNPHHSPDQQGRLMMRLVTHCKQELPFVLLMYSSVKCARQAVCEAWFQRTSREVSKMRLQKRSFAFRHSVLVHISRASVEQRHVLRNSGHARMLRLRRRSSWLSRQWQGLARQVPVC